MRSCTEVVEETEEGDDEFEAEILPEGVSGHLERLSYCKSSLERWKNR